MGLRLEAGSNARGGNVKLEVGSQIGDGSGDPREPPSQNLTPGWRSVNLDSTLCNVIPDQLSFKFIEISLLEFFELSCTPENLFVWYLTLFLGIRLFVNRSPSLN